MDKNFVHTIDDCNCYAGPDLFGPGNLLSGFFYVWDMD